jgi:hypothetical protein
LSVPTTYFIRTYGAPINFYCVWPPHRTIRIRTVGRVAADRRMTFR